MRNANPTVCVVLGEHISNYYTGPLVRGIVASAAEFGCRVLLYSPLTVHLTSRTLTLDDLPLLPRGVDAYLLPAYIANDVLAYCAREPTAILVYSGLIEGVPSIGPDNYAGAYAATNHLIGHGRRTIAHLSGLPDSREAAARLEGYRAALHDAALPIDESLVAYGHFQLQAAEEAVERMLRAGKRFDAIFAANDMEALGALNALGRAGLRVPEDVALVGFDDAELAAALDPPLTTVRQSSFQIGWDAVRLLSSYGGERPLPKRSTTPARLIVRRSCGCEADRASTMPWDERLAERLGSRGLLATPAEAAAWVAPLHGALERQYEINATLDQLTASAEKRGWNLAALLEHIAIKLAALAAEQPDSTRHAARSSAAIGLIAARIEAREESRRLERTNRVNAINYVIDLLRAYSHDQSIEAALHYMATSGPRASVSVQRGVVADTVVAQYVGDAGEVFQRQMALADFPPADWPAPGEALLLMPLEAGAQQRMLVGVVERGGREYLDLDDLLLRSINTYRSITVLNETLRELDAARSVQLSLLPRTPPQSNDYDIAGATRPARQVGGDLYGYYVRPSGALALALGDVAGKGMPAALLMSACATAIAGTISAGLAPGLTLNQIHQVLAPSVGRTQNAAICLVYLDGAAVRVANAGAIAPLLRNALGAHYIDVGGLPLGTALSGSAPYQEQAAQLQPGDMLILSSDGIVEARNEQGELYGFERFADAAASGPGDSATAMLAHLFANVAAFAGNAEIYDDMAIVVARYHGYEGE